MSRQVQSKDVPVTVHHSFYVPHDRAKTWFTGEKVNPITGEISFPPSMTKQSFKDECDINNIIKSYSVTGQLTHINAKAAQGAYQDLPDEVDFQTSLNVIKAATESFATLPSHVRARFNNDPAQFLAFMEDANNVDEMVKMGLASKRPETASGGGNNKKPPLPPAAAAAPIEEPKKPA